MIATEVQKMIREMARADRHHAFPTEALAEMGGLVHALETRTAAVGIWLFWLP